MKSIGNGWKRAQEARLRTAKNDLAVWVCQQQLDSTIRRAQYAKENFATWVKAPEPAPTLWQRIKRAFLRSKK